MNGKKDAHHRVPWEPYRGAINAAKSRRHEPASSFEKEDLVRYKVDTDLDLFNAQRPGYLFDVSDFERIDKPASETATTTNTVMPFVDARFYTDFHFLKLANELKKKCVSPSKASALKPVNVVGPMLDKKAKTAAATLESTEAPGDDSGSGRTTTTPSSLDGSNSLKIWKSQRAQYESRIEYLESQINGLNEQLQIQTQVNAELKRMLVASVGEDMQYRLERLVNDKQRLEFELVSNNASLDRMADEIEQISIQCDLWRSKFLASKLMLDELSTWKSFLLLLNRENENVLSNLINDNKIINDKLLRANDLLASLRRQNEFKEAKAPRYNSIQLANSILSHLGSMVTGSVVEKRNYERLRQDKTLSVKFKTNNELIAEQLLEQFDWLTKCVLCPSAGSAGTSSSDQMDSLDKLEELIGRIKLKRSTTHSRLFQVACAGADAHLLLNVCNQCTGQLRVV